MRFSVEQWAPDYAAPLDAELAGLSDAAVDETVEVPLEEWKPLRPEPLPQGCVLFVDGVQRIDAWVWIGDGSAGARPGICASYAAGVVRCDGRATIDQVEVRRGLFSPSPGEGISTPRAAYPPRAAAVEDPDQLRQAVQQRMGELEVELAGRAGEADLIVIDGPLRGRQNVPGAIGYVKTHHVRYLSEEAQTVLGALAPGERTPLFLMTTSWSRYSWYLRLPGATGHEWAGIVRCEAAADLPATEAARMAGLSAAWLPRFASEGHKDPRAPQNLYPIGGLERELKRRLGDASLLYRDLRLAAAGAPIAQS